MTPSPDEVRNRLQAAARLTRLDAETRLEAKLDMSARAIAARLREASDLLTLCRRLDVTAQPPRPR